MTVTDFYNEFGYTELIDVRKAHQKIDVNEFYKLGVDKVHFSGGFPAIFFKEIKQFDEKNLNEIAQIQHLAWNYRKVMFLFVLSTTEIRIYNCNKKPFNYKSDEIKIEKELKNLELISSEFRDKNNIRIIEELFSRISADCGIVWTTDNSLREKIDVRKRIDRYLVKSLLDAAKEIKKLGLDEDIIHSLLMRSIFIMYLEDKGAANETNLYTEINEKARSYLDILENKKDTYKLFDKLEEHFNGDVFPLIRGEKRKVTRDHLKVIQKCLLDGDLSDDPKLFTWRLFRFDVIQIELLSEIYENFLDELKPNKKVESGQYYTPSALVELILNEKLKITNEKAWEFKVLDPACGSGIFLVESFNRLVKRWKNAHKEQRIKFSDLKKILTSNIFGIEYDKFAIRVTAFSLYLAIVEHLNPKTLWKNKNNKFPYLINDPQDNSLEAQGRNLFRADTIGEIKGKEIPKANLVVGNPPFGARIKLKSIKDYCKKFGYGQDMVIPFLHKAIDFTNEEGSVALIFNTKILTNTEGPFQNFRKWLFNESYVEKIYNFSIFRKAPKTFGGQLFTSAVGPVSIVFYQKIIPKRPLSTIEYWAPKTYVKNNLIEGVIIDSTDIKFLPREECAKPDTKIWKIAMWGSIEDYKLIERLNNFNKLKTFIDENELKKGLGLQFLDESTKLPKPDSDIPKLPYINPGAVNRYYSNTNDFSNILSGLTSKSIKKYKEYYNLVETSSLKIINVFRRLGNKEVFKGPHVLIKEGLQDKQICASYIEESCSFNSKVLGITNNNKEILKAITSFINSSLSTYYLFLISSSIGIEREEIKPNELYELPFNLLDNSLNELSQYLDKIIKEIDLNYPLKINLSNFEDAIDEEIYKSFELTENERILISDFIKYNLELIFLGYKSTSLKPTTDKESFQFADIICKELNEFLKSKIVVNASVFELQKFNPLNMIKLTIESNQCDITKLNDYIFNKYLSEIDKYLLRKEAKNIYIKKQIKYFDGNKIYIIKPNQKRFWSRSAAINDARELVGEILKMK